jgi:hypothetical protein
VESLSKAQSKPLSGTLGLHFQHLEHLFHHGRGLAVIPPTKKRCLSPLAGEWKAYQRRSLNHFRAHLGFIFGILSISFITAVALQ